MGRSNAQYPGVRPESQTSIVIDFRFRGQRCRERIKLKPTPANLKAAARHREAVLDAIAKGTFDYAVTFPDSPKALEFAPLKGTVITLETWLEQWFDVQKDHVASSTLKDYRNSVFNVLIPAFGTLRLAELRRGHVKHWGAGLQVSNKRIANLLSPLRLALQDALEDDLIDSNPLYGWTYQRKEAPKSDHDVQPFTAQEQHRILDALSGSGKNLIQFAFWTGLRTSELVALEWGDADWLAGAVHIRRALTQAAKAPERTKTRAGTRQVKLLPPALQALKAQREHSLLHPSGRIWLDPRSGEPWTGDQAIRKTLWTPALKRAGVRYRNPYQTRHTYASMMLSAGENELWVAGQMGHADVNMIRKNYGRWIPDSAPDAGTKAVELFSEWSGFGPDHAGKAVK